MSTTPAPGPAIDKDQDSEGAVATGRAGYQGVLLAMCLSLVLVVASVTVTTDYRPDPKN
ncbi:hypothetical protein [Streptomyces sp. NPDC088748]|uniref:hypothetical protein n=1 Tax=Streptomyces sp. NPDC088748 TaxID=3365887 RepID=UPI0038089764